MEIEATSIYILLCLFIRILVVVVLLNRKQHEYIGKIKRRFISAEASMHRHNKHTEVLVISFAVSRIFKPIEHNSTPLAFESKIYPNHHELCAYELRTIVFFSPTILDSLLLHERTH